MCNGQAADDCDVMYLAEFDSILNDRLEELDNEFSSINEILESKKEAFINLYRKDPRLLHHDTLVRFKRYIESFDPTPPEKETIVCESFSDTNKNVTVSSCKRSVKSSAFGYCFINHPPIGKNQILKWSLRVPKFGNGIIGIVIIDC